VHDAKQFEVEQILDVDFESIGTGLLFKVRYAAPFSVPSEDTWEPMRGVAHLNIFSEFLQHMFIENLLRPLTSSDFATAGLQECPRNQDRE
jgi:hypothetical protein